MDTKLLEKIGLTPGEIKAYLALLALGPSSTGPLAKKSQVSRSKLYWVMDKLEKKGLASHAERNGVIYFQAVEPTKIDDYIQEKEDELGLLREEFIKFLPELESFHKRAKETQSMTLYQGLKGLKVAHEHSYLKLKRGEEYVYMGVPAYQPETHHLYWQKDHMRRASLGIKTRLLFNNDTDGAIMENRNSYPLCDARYMPTDIKTPAYFLIYKDTVMMAIPSTNPIAIEIVSQEIADAFMAYFEEYWKRTKPFKKRRR
jgi:DNA-binding MarR family transcriptional regulator